MPASGDKPYDDLTSQDEVESIMQPGGGMPLHTNKVEHEQYVLQGSARVQIGDDVHHVKAGDVVYIPGGVPHTYEAGDEGFSFLCVVPNQPDQIELVDC